MGAPIADGRSPEPTALAAAPETRAVKGYSVTRLPYRTRRAGDPAQNFADLYLPDGKHPSRSVPLVILVHGGSWKAEYDLTMMRPFAIDLVRRGFAVYNIEFRRVGSGGGWPTTFTDAADAVNGLVDLARTRPQLDLAETVILGYSSGGQLATWLACRHRLSGNRTVSHELGSTPRFRPARVVSVSAPLAMAFAAEHGNSRIVALMGGTPEQVPERYRAVDPIALIDPQVPVIAVHGDSDRLVPAVLSTRYISAVVAAGGLGRLVVAPGSSHGTVARRGTASYREILDIVTGFTRKSVEEMRNSRPR